MNKVSTKVELQFDVDRSEVLTEKQKEIIKRVLVNRINKSGILVMQCDETRSQHRNKQLLVQRFFELIDKSLKPQKKRKSTKIPKKAVEKRLEDKKRKSEKKQRRQEPDF